MHTDTTGTCTKEDDSPAMTAPILTMPMAFSNSTYRMQCSQPLGVKIAVVTVTTTGKCTKAHRGIDTCKPIYLLAVIDSRHVRCSSKGAYSMRTTHYHSSVCYAKS